MHVRKKDQASITVFASLSLLLVASFLLVLLEAARVHGLSSYAKMVRMQSLESLFSNYNRHIFDEYGIFLLDGGFGKGQMDLAGINGYLQDYSQNNLRPVIGGIPSYGTTVNAYQMDAVSCAVENYLVATDADGAPFRHMIALRQKKLFPVSVASNLRDGYQQADTFQSRGRQNQMDMEQANTHIDQAKQEREEQRRRARELAEQMESEDAPDQDVSREEGPPEPEIENPIETMKTLRSRDLLDLVLPASKGVSNKSIPSEEMLLKRELLSGNMEYEADTDWYEDILFLQYLNEQFDCFTTATADETHALDLEKEYLLCGKASDRENLKAVVGELLLIREGANFLYLQTDAVKQEEAYAVATALLASTGLVGLAGVVAQGILAAWAFAESVLDIRTLLNDGKISWMKTAADWTTDLSGIGQLASGTMEAKRCANGEDYEGYIEKMLFLKGRRELNFRTMDLIEQQLHQLSGYETAKMDQMLLAVNVRFEYQARPLFSGLVTVETLSDRPYTFAENESFSYLSNYNGK